MAAEERRIFSTEMVLSLFAGKLDDIKEMTTHLLGREVSSKAAILMVPAMKNWFLSQVEGFGKIGVAENAPNYSVWLEESKQKLGGVANVSVEAIPAAALAKTFAVIEDLEAVEQTNAENMSVIAGLTKQVKAMEPASKKLADEEKKSEQLNEKVKELTAEVAAVKKELAGFAGKVPIDIPSIESSIKDSVAKAIKEAMANLPAGAAVGAAVAGAVADFAGAGDAAADTAAVPDSFGFGTSGSDGDGFGF